MTRDRWVVTVSRTTFKGGGETVTDVVVVGTFGDEDRACRRADVIRRRAARYNDPNLHVLIEPLLPGAMSAAMVLDALYAQQGLEPGDGEGESEA